MPGDSGVTVVTNARAFYTTRAAAGALGARHSLRPLISESGKLMANLARNRRRDRRRLSSPGLTGRSSIPETSMMESKGRGVLDPRFRGDDDHCWSRVVPAKAGTHNHRSLLEHKPSAILPKAKPRRMGPCFRRDDTDRSPHVVGRKKFQNPCKFIS
jgi:hypothetical protein